MADVSSFEVDNEHVSKRRNVIETILNHFWRRWRTEYVTELRERQKALKPRKSATVEVGDVVLIFDEKQPRHLWRIGRVNKLIESGDGLVRGAEIIMGKTRAITRRPISKLYPLVMNTRKGANNASVPRSAKNITECQERPKRKAAIAGELRRKQTANLGRGECRINRNYFKLT